MRKVLGYGRAEWDKLPWHDQRMYLEELAADLDGRRSDGDEHYQDEGQGADHDALMRAGLPDPPEGDVGEVASQRPDWLRLPIKEAQLVEG